MIRKSLLFGMATAMTLFLLLPNFASAVWTAEPDYHHSAFCCSDRELVWDSELALWCDAYVPDDAIQLFLFQPSFSGGFINNLATEAERVIATSSDWNLPAHFSYVPVTRGTRYNRYWDDAVDSGATFLDAYNYATTNCPYSGIDLPQYYSENTALDGMDLGSATGDQYAILFTGLVTSPASLAMELSELDFIWDTLVTDYGYDPDNIMVLFNDGTGAAYIDDAATKLNLYSAVNDLRNIMDSTDSFFLWVSGNEGFDCFRPSTAPVPVRPPEVLGRKVLNFNIVGANFNTGGIFAENVALTAFTESCNGQQDLEQVNDNIFVWHQGDVDLTVNNSHIAQAHSECAKCKADAVAMQTTNYVVDANGWAINELACVFAGVAVHDNTPGDCVAHAELHKTITATDWVIGNIFWLNLQLDMGGKFVAPGNLGGHAFLQWFGGLDVTGLENLWELEIAIENDLLVVDFTSDDDLGLDDVAIESIIYDAFVQDDNLWWQAELIDIGNIPITIHQANWQLNSVLIAHAEAPCPEPSTLCLLVIGAFFALVLWRRKRR